jgi:G3E family GTPase
MKRIKRRVPPDQQVPVILVTGVAPEPIAAATIALQWDLPSAVVVRHDIDSDAEVLMRTVSDAAGVQERLEIDVEHACINCAIREDIIPTLERLAASGRWGAIIAQLPVTAEPTQVCRVIGYSPEVAPHVRIAASVVALEAETIVADLLGDDLLVERGLPVRDDDERGVGETASAMVEYADVVALFGEHDAAGWELLRAIIRPGAELTTAIGEVDVPALLDGVHNHDRSEDWVAVVREGDVPTAQTGAAWVLDFRSERPFHPERLQENIEALGRGARRSRGCFWLPSRPAQVCQWDGAGGMVSIGPAHHWESDAQLTRIVVVGLDDGRDELAQAFERCLLTDEELAERGRFWEVADDGYEPWLGPVRSLAIKEV